MLLKEMFLLSLLIMIPKEAKGDRQVTSNEKAKHAQNGEIWNWGGNIPALKTELCIEKKNCETVKEITTRWKTKTWK